MKVFGLAAVVAALGVVKKEKSKPVGVGGTFAAAAGPGPSAAAIAGAETLDRLLDLCMARSGAELSRAGQRYTAQRSTAQHSAAKAAGVPGSTPTAWRPRSAQSKFAGPPSTVGRLWPPGGLYEMVQPYKTQDGGLQSGIRKRRQKRRQGGTEEAGTRGLRTAMVQPWFFSISIF